MNVLSSPAGVKLAGVFMCTGSLSSSAPGVSEVAPWSHISLDSAGVEQSSTMPRRPPRVSRHQRRASDSFPATAQEDDPSKTGHEQPAPITTALDRLKSDDRSAESLKSPVRSSSKTFASPVVVSPSNTGVLAPTNTRRIGSKFCIDLVKGLLVYQCCFC